MYTLGPQTTTIIHNTGDQALSKANPTAIRVSTKQEVFPVPFLTPSNPENPANVGFQFLLQTAQGTICMTIAYALRDIAIGEQLYR